MFGSGGDPTNIEAAPSPGLDSPAPEIEGFLNNRAAAGGRWTDFRWRGAALLVLVIMPPFLFAHCRFDRCKWPASLVGGDVCDQLFERRQGVLVMFCQVTVYVRISEESLRS